MKEYAARQPVQRCGVDGCEFQTKDKRNLKQHQARVHGMGDVDAEELRRKKRERMQAYRAQHAAQRCVVDGGESEKSESEMSESEESGAPVEPEQPEKEPAEEEPDMPAVGSTVVVKWGSKDLPSEVVQANVREVPDRAPRNSTRTVLGFVVSWMGIGEDSESFVPMTGGLEWRVRREPSAGTLAGTPAERRRSPPAIQPEERRPPPESWHCCDTPGCGFRAPTSEELAEHTESKHDYMDV